MVKLLAKLAVTAFLASAGWRIGSEYLTHHRFREAVRAATATHRSDEELRGAILAEAARFGVPLMKQDVEITLDERHSVVTGTYVKVIELVPGYARPWTFNWTVETFNAPSIDPVPVAP